MSNRRQSGFGIIGIIAIILVVGVLGFVGWRVFTAQSNNTGNNQTNNAQTDPNAGYVVIKEWGVRFKPVGGLNGVEYNVSGNATTFTTQQLKRLDANCSGQLSGVTVLGRIDRSTAASVPHYPASFAKVGDYYYYYHSPEATCSDDASVQAIETAGIQYFKNSIATFEVAQ